jgi:hypothetical protein
MLEVLDNYCDEFEIKINASDIQLQHQKNKTRRTK